MTTLQTYSLFTTLWLQFINHTLNTAASFGPVVTKPSQISHKKIQSQAASVLTFANYDYNADILLDKIGWEKLETQRKIQKAVKVHKSLNGLGPDYLMFHICDAAL